MNISFFRTLLTYLAPSVFSNFFVFSFGTVAAVVSTAAGVKGLFSGGGGGGGGTSQQYDPYGPYRAEAASQLHDLMADPGLTFGQPGYQTQLRMGQQSVNRGMAATGQLQSGAEQIALQDLGQSTFSSFYNNKLANLMQLSGASQSPAAAGYSQAQANNLNSLMNQRNMQNITGGMGSLNTIYNSSKTAPVNDYGLTYNPGDGYGISNQYSGMTPDETANMMQYGV